MPTLELEDLDLYYEVRGSGRRLLVCNGSGSSIESSAPIIDTLAQHCQVLVHDQRGLGRTGLPRSGRVTMADYAADAAALLDHMGWDTTALFGISFGGMVAQEIAVTHPERIERLVLLCTSPGGEGGSSYPLHTLAGMDPGERARIALRNLDTRFDEKWLAEHPFDQTIVDLQNARAARERTPDEMKGELLQLEARRHHDVWDRLPRITCPTFIGCGDFDGLAPPSNSEAIRRRIAGSEVHHYQGGHLFIYQDRDAFRDIFAFLTD